MTHRLDQVAPPNLPVAKDQYIRTEEEEYRKVERLYYNRISHAVNSVIGDVGGRFLQTPHGYFSDSTTQSDGANTPNAIKFNTTYTNETIGFTVEDDGLGNPTRITAQYAGEYNFQFSIQLENQDNVQNMVGIWARINGTDVPDSCTDITVPARKSATIFGYAVAAWNFIYPMEAGDYFELMWATESALVVIPYIPAWTTPTNPYNRPATPSAILSVSFMSVL